MILNCRRFTDATPRIRLVAARASGLVQIYTLARDDNGTWSIPSAPSEVEGVPTPLNSGMFVLDAHTGAPCKADKAHLTVALDSKPSPKAPEEGVLCLLLVVGAKGARCIADFWNERVARAEWDHKVGNVVHAQVVERNGILSFDFMSFCSLTERASRILRAGRIYGQARWPRVFSPDVGTPAHVTTTHCLIDVSLHDPDNNPLIETRRFA
jgi:hypothetical protein